MLISLSCIKNHFALYEQNILIVRTSWTIRVYEHICVLIKFLILIQSRDKFLKNQDKVSIKEQK